MTRLFCLSPVAAIAGLVMALAACSQAPAGGAGPQTASASACSAQASRVLVNADKSEITLTAQVSGPTCAAGAVFLVARGKDGSPLITWSSPASYLFSLGEAANAADMQTRLAEWLDGGSPAETTGGLAEWPKGADGPQSGEFPFYPDESVERDVWEDIRAANDKMWCHVQGMESMACYGYNSDAMYLIGLQTFPG